MSGPTKKENAKINGKQTDDDIRKCGVIMPISNTHGYPNGHWAEVLAILKDVIERCGLQPNLVSDAEGAGIIHNRIVKNLSENPIVICDVSSKNPNVMFELGLRLALDKAVIIVKDNETDYSFDTSPIEHIGYPKDLRHSMIEVFKKTLEAKIKGTIEESGKEGYSPFLKHFNYTKPKIEGAEDLSLLQYIEKQFDAFNQRLDNLQSSQSGSGGTHFDFKSYPFEPEQPSFRVLTNPSFLDTESENTDMSSEIAKFIYQRKKKS
jgi:hypothetical protein